MQRSLQVIVVSVVMLAGFTGCGDGETQVASETKTDGAAQPETHGAAESGSEPAPDPQRVLEAATLSASDLGEDWRVIESASAADPDACAPSFDDAIGQTPPQAFTRGTDPAVATTAGAITAVYPTPAAAQQAVTQFSEQDFSACMQGSGAAEVEIEQLASGDGTYVEAALNAGPTGSAALGVALIRNGNAVSPLFVLSPAGDSPKETVEELATVVRERIADA